MSLWRQRLMLQLPISTIWCMTAANTTSFCHSSTTAVLDRMRASARGMIPAQFRSKRSAPREPALYANRSIMLLPLP